MARARPHLQPGEVDAVDAAAGGLVFATVIGPRRAASWVRLAALMRMTFAPVALILRRPRGDGGHRSEHVDALGLMRVSSAVVDAGIEVPT